jgi:hypothetical protein
MQKGTPPIEVCGVPLPAGTLVWVHTFAMHRQSALWRHATSFRPERWLQPPSAQEQRQQQQQQAEQQAKAKQQQQEEGDRKAEGAEGAEGEGAGASSSTGSKTAAAAAAAVAPPYDGMYTATDVLGTEEAAHAAAQARQPPGAEASGSGGASTSAAAAAAAAAAGKAAAAVAAVAAAAAAAVGKGEADEEGGAPWCSREVFMPWGRGPHACVGQGLALASIKATLAILVGWVGAVGKVTGEGFAPLVCGGAVWSVELVLAFVKAMGRLS